MHFDVELPQEFQEELKKSVIETLSDSLGSLNNDSKFGDWMDKGTACQYIGVSRSTFDKIIKKYNVPYTLLGGSYFFSKAELNKFMLSQQNK